MVLLPFDCVLDDYSKSDKKLINLKKNNVRKQNARANTVTPVQTSVLVEIVGRAIGGKQVPM